MNSQGEAKELERVYRDHRAYVLRCVRRLGASEASAEDAVHDVFLVVARRLGEFRGEAQLRTWLFAVAMRVVQNRRRGEGRRKRKASAFAVSSSKAWDSGAFAQLESAEILYKLLDQLPDKMRVVYVLAELEGHSAPEIASTLGLPVNTVYSRLRTAKQSMHAAANRLQRSSEPNRKEARA